MQVSDEKLRSSIFKIYVSNSSYVNNWDLVDLSAQFISGSYLFDKPKTLLYQFAKSKLLWERRIALLSTFHYIKKNQFDDTLAISKLLLNDKEDLIHKAIGWMLREIGKKDRQVEIDFITANYNQLPRTTLRYAIEHFPEGQRKNFLKGVSI
jgi:3-methyladenine DNA glycosylase AlkD